MSRYKKVQKRGDSTVMVSSGNIPSGTLAGEESAQGEKAAIVIDERRDAGLEGLVGNLDSVIITTETDHLVPAVYELL